MLPTAAPAMNSNAFPSCRATYHIPCSAPLQRLSSPFRFRGHAPHGASYRLRALRRTPRKSSPAHRRACPHTDPRPPVPRAQASARTARHHLRLLADAADFIAVALPSVQDKGYAQYGYNYYRHDYSSQRAASYIHNIIAA